MDEHKRAILRVWWAYPMEPYSGSEVDRLQGHPPFVLGGVSVVRQVRRLLRREMKAARLQWESAMERERGSDWWMRYVEDPADHGLHETLMLSVPRRKGEPSEDYEERLKRVEAAMRARLPTFVRSTARDA